MTVSVRNPRKSILRSPSSSSVVIVNCVTSDPSDASDSGTYSSIASLPITTPAACIDACRGRPSRRMEASTSSFTCGSSSYAFFSSGFTSSERFNVTIFSFCIFLGIIFEMESTYAYGKSITRPTSRITALAAIVPKVTIWATQSIPYFPTTYSMTS